MMQSNDYFKGYEQGISDVLNSLKDAQKMFVIFSNRKNFKGLSRRDVVSKCWELIENVIKEYEK